MQVLIPNGAAIKNLRANHPTLNKQAALADSATIDQRHLRRIENGNQRTSAAVLGRIAKCLGVPLEAVAFSIGKPALASGSVLPREVPAAQEEEFEVVPRMREERLQVVNANELMAMASRTWSLVYHLLAAMEGAVLNAAEELLVILQIQTSRTIGGSQDDVFEIAPLPEMARLRRIGELLVILKGHDVRFLAGTGMRNTDTDDQTPRRSSAQVEFQLIVAFAPPRGEYDEVEISVPFDCGRPVLLPRHPVF